MNYWIEDYESPSTDNGIDAFKKDIIKRCIELIETKKYVRIGYVMLDEMKLQAFKSDLLEVLFELEQIGKYKYEVIQMDGGSDFIVSKKLWRDRNRFWATLLDSGITHLLTLLLGMLLGYVIRIL